MCRRVLQAGEQDAKTRTKRRANPLEERIIRDAGDADQVVKAGVQAGSKAAHGSFPAASGGVAHAPANAMAARLAAMDALASLPPAEPVPRVDYVSAGRLLIIAHDAALATRAAAALADSLGVAVLWSGAGEAPRVQGADVVAGRVESLSGHLGKFELVFQPASGPAQLAPFDLVLDLAPAPQFTMHLPPQGYYRAPAGEGLDAALAELPGMTGEFEKPRFFDYRANLCAHSRSQKAGCNRCIEVCSTAAISPAGDTVSVDPHLCMGCGACATVCPSGAMNYQYPRVADRGAQLKSMLAAYRQGGRGAAAAPVVLFHDASARPRVEGDALPPHVLPLEAWHIASTGLEVLLGAIAYGAAHVAVLAPAGVAPQYREALAAQMGIGQALLAALGYGGHHFSLVDDPAQAAASAGDTVPVPAGFNLSNDKRGALEFVIEHLLRHARSLPDAVALPVGSPYGAVAVDASRCTLCMACAGACPASALMDGHDQPMLKFLERNCVQCGLCASTCPEDAIRLVPRLDLTGAAKREVVLNQSEPFNCVSCGKVLGTKLMVEAMLGRLAGHSMFQGGALNRLRMCADCRVVDMMSNPNEVSVLTGAPKP